MNPNIGIRISLNLAKCFMVLLKIVHFPYLCPETQGNNDMSSPLKHHTAMVLPAIPNCKGLGMYVKEAIAAPAI